jgi:hypothetical protein
MDKIVDINERIDRIKQRKQWEQHRGKIKAIHKIIQCSSCHFRCAMCGVYLKETDSTSDAEPTLGHTFCASCRGEFEDYLSVFKGKKPSDVFWHNKEWESMWSAWLNYRRAITGFMNSSEYKLMLEDVDKHT